jgi:hypothetical protein
MAMWQARVAGEEGLVMQARGCWPLGRAMVMVMIPVLVTVMVMAAQGWVMAHLLVQGWVTMM